jgi:hypothetical protein
MGDRKGVTTRLAREAMVGKPEVQVVKAAPKKVRASTSYYLDPKLVDECRDTVVQLAGAPEFLTMTGLMTRALETELARLKALHNKGKRFPPRGPRKVKVGRPLE